MLPGSLTSRRLLEALNNQLENSHKSVLAPHPCSNDWSDRNSVVSWLLTLNSSLKFNSDTMALSVLLLDRFIDLMKIQSKYLRCVAVSCFYVAVKINEEDEIIPSTQTFVRQTRCGYTVSEVLRMERIILTKLSWNLWSPTAVDFVHTLHALMMIHNPDLLDPLLDMTPSQHVALITRKLFLCLQQRTLLPHSPSTLAAALISLELEQFTSRWFTVVMSMQKLLEVDNAKLIACREHLTRYLIPLNQLNTPYHFSPSFLRKPVSIKRKVTPDTHDDPVKRIFSEESTDDPLFTSCSSEVRPEQDDLTTTAIAT